MKKVLVVSVGVVAVAAVLAVLMITATRNNDAVIMAQTRGQRADSIIERGREFNLVCIIQPDECAELIARAEKNPRLKEVFLEAKAAGVSVMPATWTLLAFFAGKVGDGYVLVNIQASDERIIAYLAK